MAALPGGRGEEERRGGEAALGTMTQGENRADEEGAGAVALTHPVWLNKVEVQYLQAGREAG